MFWKILILFKNLPVSDKPSAVMDSSFKSNHLLLPELNYELRIRNITTQKSQDEKSWGDLLRKNKEILM